MLLLFSNSVPRRGYFEKTHATNYQVSEACNDIKAFNFKKQILEIWNVCLDCQILFQWHSTALWLRGKAIRNHQKGGIKLKNNQPQGQIKLYSCIQNRLMLLGFFQFSFYKANNSTIIQPVDSLVSERRKSKSELHSLCCINILSTNVWQIIRYTWI